MPLQTKDPDDIIEPLVDDRRDSQLPRNRRLLPRGPKSFRLEKTGTGVRVVAYAWPAQSIDVPGSSASQFLVYWCETLDQSTPEGISAGFARATLLSPAIATAGAESRPDQPLVAFFGDPKYRTGWFFLVGANVDGALSDPSAPRHLSGGPGGTIPLDVEHFRASESGEQHDLATLSIVSYSFRIPLIGAPIESVQFMYLNYPNLNEFQEGESRRVTAGRGGTQTGKLRFPIGRRYGEGSITIVGTAITGTGANLLSVAAAAGGDQLEVFGIRARIASVASNDAATLVDPWTGPAVTDVFGWQTIAAVTIFAVAEGVDGARRDDPENAPSVTLDFDGLLSAPIAPALTLASTGNAVLVTIDTPDGTDLARALLYRRKGSGFGLLVFDKSAWEMVQSFEIDHSNPSPSFQWADADFTTFERENGDVFSYAATVVNVRDQESDASEIAEISCRLDSGKDGSDPVFKIGLKNLLFNAAFGGTIGVAVAANETSQRNSFGALVAGTDEPGRPYGTTGGHGGQAAGVGRFRGHTYWEANDGGTGATAPAPTFQGGEVRISPPGVGKIWYLFQEDEAWDTALGAAFIKVRKDGTVCWQVKLARQVGGSQPNGFASVYIDLYDNNTFRGEAPRRQRDSGTDEFAYVTGASAHVEISGADLITDWQIFFGVFKLDSSLGTIKQARFNVAWLDGTQGTVRVADAMVNDGEEPGVFTPDMSDPTVAWPIPFDPPGTYGDGDGTRRGVQTIIPVTP
jgi:hypothetical protein